MFWCQIFVLDLEPVVSWVMRQVLKTVVRCPSHQVILAILAILVIIALQSAHKAIRVLLVLVYPERELFRRLLLEDVVNDPELTNVHAEWQEQHHKQDLQLFIRSCPAKDPVAKSEKEWLSRETIKKKKN